MAVSPAMVATIGELLPWKKPPALVMRSHSAHTLLSGNLWLQMSQMKVLIWPPAGMAGT